MSELQQLRLCSRKSIKNNKKLISMRGTTSCLQKLSAEEI